MPIVSLKNDVGPILQLSCSIAGSTCHGDSTVTSQGRPYFGLPDGGISADTIHAAVVGVASTEDPKLSLVTPGDLDKSWLWQKVDNQQCNFASECAAGGSAYPTCGLQMPYGNNSLPVSELDTIARWITQGAKNN
jgi:hypothetical protein